MKASVTWEKTGHLKYWDSTFPITAFESGLEQTQRLGSREPDQSLLTSPRRIPLRQFYGRPTQTQTVG